MAVLGSFCYYLSFLYKSQPRQDTEAWKVSLTQKGASRICRSGKARDGEEKSGCGQGVDGVTRLEAERGGALTQATGIPAGL